MKDLPVPYANTRGLARALYDQAKPGGPANLTARPYNHYDSDNTLWWLTPTREWPAYQHGKFTVLPLPELGDDPLVLVGLTVEKGAGTGVPVPPNQVLREDWAWNGFFEAIKIGELDRLAGAVIRQSGHPLTFAVRTHYVNPKADFLSDRYESPSSFWIAEYDGWAMRELHGEFKLPDTEGMRHASRFSELAGFLSSLKGKLDWLWVDVYVGLAGRLGRDDPAAWTAARLWQEACVPWHRWFA